jgi:hypothetical protein
MNINIREIIENILFLLFLGLVTWFALVLGNI